MTTAQGLLELIDLHVARYPLMALQDVYKLLYQGVLGPGHLIAEPEVFKARLLAEYEAIPAAADEPLVEPVRPDGRLLRVHLRPFKARRGDLGRLLDACVEAARARWGTPDDLAAAWAAVAQACQAGRWPYLGEGAAFAEWLDAHSHGAIHHSPRYREAYRPAYRLVSDAGPHLIYEVAHA